MTLSRRQFLSMASGAALFTALASVSPATLADTFTGTAPGLTASPSGIVVVELINFGCPRCRAVNDHVFQFEKAAQAAGIGFRVAPVAWETQSIWPDRVYYAARDLFPASATLIRDSLFDGLQREGMRFEDVPQVMAFLDRRDIPKQLADKVPNFKLSDIAAYANDDATLLSETKAGHLLDLTLAQEVPVFVWLKDGNVLFSLSPADAQDPLALSQLVLKKLTTKAITK